MVGTYKLENKGHLGTLILASDGGAKEVVTRPKGQRIELKQTWKLEGRSLYRTPCIHFEPEEEEGETSSTYCSQAVNKTLKGVTIEIASDFGFVYERR